MDDRDFEWLHFANAELSPRAAHAVLDRFGSPSAVLQADPDALADVAELTEDQRARLLDAARAPTTEHVALFDRLGLHIIPRDSPDYPPLLRQTPERPPVLLVRGDLDERDQFAVAIVGTRRPSPYGREVAAKLARDLAEMGFTIVSGGAVGIDTAAHAAVVRSGGRTVVVLGCGLDVPYPSLNQALFRDVVESGLGALITEFPLGAQPEAWRFPARNRIISGMSLGVVVVEAGQQSGALITAGTAADQGRDVMAVPGNIDRPHSMGANALIRDGAALVTCAQDVINALGVLVLERPKDQTPSSREAELPEVQRRLISHLNLTPKHIDVLAAEAGVGTAEASAQLTLLELAGLIHRQPGGCFIRAL